MAIDAFSHLFIRILLSLLVFTSCSKAPHSIKGYSPLSNKGRIYAEMYGSLAVEEMLRSGVPASIKLAQGILASGYGVSFLARHGNNHFGIKCHGWRGKKLYLDDDGEGDCFRVYASVQQSYRDHTIFLRNNRRYHFLFKLQTSDYHSWAYGLKRAGYATNPDYPGLLINIIERDRLYLYDSMTAQRL